MPIISAADAIPHDDGTLLVHIRYTGGAEARLTLSAMVAQNIALALAGGTGSGSGWMVTTGQGGGVALHVDLGAGGRDRLVMACGTAFGIAALLGKVAPAAAMLASRPPMGDAVLDGYRHAYSACAPTWKLAAGSLAERDDQLMASGEPDGHATSGSNGTPLGRG